VAVVDKSLNIVLSKVARNRDWAVGLWGIISSEADTDTDRTHQSQSVRADRHFKVVTCAGDQSTSIHRPKLAIRTNLVSIYC
jgi:hypothetical protein